MSSEADRSEAIDDAYDELIEGISEYGTIAARDTFHTLVEELNG